MAVNTGGQVVEETEVYLPVRRMPLRTGCYWFSIDNGSAMTYAVNDISLQLSTGYGPVDYYEAQYIDIPTGEPVISTLMPQNKAVTESAPSAVF